MIVLLVAMAVMAGLIAGGRWLLTRGADPEPNPSPTTTTASPTTTTGSPSPSPTTTGPVQQTLLMQVRNDEQVAVNNVLLGTRRDPEEGVMLGVQPRLLVDVPAGTQSVVELTGQSTNASLSQRSLSNLLGVQIDATWTLDRLAFSGLVDSIGGIYLDVKTPVVFRGPSGKVLFTLPKGIAKLDGPMAATYVLTRLPGEPESARMARYQEVVRQVLLGLPVDKAKLELLLGSLGALSRTTVPVDALSDILLRLHGNVDRNRVTHSDLPVKSATTGPAATDRLNFTAAEAIVTRDFAPTQLIPGGDVPVRVLVFNGVGKLGLGATTRAPLEGAGFVYLTGGDAARVGYTESLVEVPADVPGAAAWAAKVAKTLRLPATAVRATDAAHTTADVTVTLGADYRPASAPTPEPTQSPEPTPTS